MVKNTGNIIIDNEAKQQLRQAFDYIMKDSLQHADKVKNKILSSIKALIKNPERYPPDKYKIDNDGTFRAYELYKYRITYRITDDKIIVIRVRNTKMNPLLY